MAYGTLNRTRPKRLKYKPQKDKYIIPTCGVADESTTMSKEEAIRVSEARARIALKRRNPGKKF